MTHREKLIELIKNCTEDISARELHSADFDEKIADYLIENSVIALPCKVGDTVWFIKSNFSFLPKPKSERVREIFMSDYDTIFKTKTRAFNDKAIGKTVFFTCSKAEQALRERESN